MSWTDEAMRPRSLEEHIAWVKTWGHPMAETVKWLQTIPDWQPIETAPKDGRWILIFKRCSEIDWYDVVLWREDDWGNGTWVDPGDMSESCADTTHWMPRPPAPKDFSHGI